MLEIRNVSKRFVKRLDLIERIAATLGSAVREQTVHAVDGVSFDVHAGEVVGLVGESGCGKSTLGRVVCGLYAPSDGEVLLGGKPVRLRAGEAPGLQMIFQDPFASLNPRMRVGDAIAEAPVAHGLVKRSAAPDYVAELLQQVGLDASFARRYPHQFSGGQRARIGIARALAVKPGLLVCDEAVAALDVSIQAQVLNLFMTLRQRLGLTVLFISHDLGVVRHLADRVVIMYLGRVVESGADRRAVRRAEPSVHAGAAGRSATPGPAPATLPADPRARSRRRSRRRAAATSIHAARMPARDAAPSDRRCARSPRADGRRAI